MTPALWPRTVLVVGVDVKVPSWAEYDLIGPFDDCADASAWLKASEAPPDFAMIDGSPDDCAGLLRELRERQVNAVLFRDNTQPKPAVQ